MCWHGGVDVICRFVEHRSLVRQHTEKPPKPETWVAFRLRSLSLHAGTLRAVYRRLVSTLPCVSVPQLLSSAYSAASAATLSVLPGLGLHTFGLS